VFHFSLRLILPLDVRKSGRKTATFTGLNQLKIPSTAYIYKLKLNYIYLVYSLLCTIEYTTKSILGPITMFVFVSDTDLILCLTGFSFQVKSHVLYNARIE